MIHDDIQTRLARLEGLVSQYATKITSLEADNTLLRQQVQIAMVQQDVSNPELVQLWTDLDRVKSVVSVGGGVTAHGVQFSHPNEIKAWILPLKNDVFIFHDAVSVLHCIGATTATHKSMLALMKAQRDAKLGSDMEARVITSFRTNLPSILYGSTAGSEPSEEYVQLSSKLKNYKMWHDDDGVSGVSERMLRGASEVLSRVSFCPNRQRPIRTFYD